MHRLAHGRGASRQPGPWRVASTVRSSKARSPVAGLWGAPAAAASQLLASKGQAGLLAPELRAPAPRRRTFMPAHAPIAAGPPAPRSPVPGRSNRGPRRRARRRFRYRVTHLACPPQRAANPLAEGFASRPMPRPSRGMANATVSASSHLRTRRGASGVVPLRRGRVRSGDCRHRRLPPTPNGGGGRLFPICCCRTQESSAERWRLAACSLQRPPAPRTQNRPHWTTTDSRPQADCVACSSTCSIRPVNRRWPRPRRAATDELCWKGNERHIGFGAGAFSGLPARCGVESLSCCYTLVQRVGSGWLFWPALSG